MQRWRDDLRTARNPTRMSMNWLVASAYRLNEFESKAVMAVTAVTAVRAVTTINRSGGTSHNWRTRGVLVRSSSAAVLLSERLPCQLALSRRILDLRDAAGLAWVQWVLAHTTMHGANRRHACCARSVPLVASPGRSESSVFCLPPCGAQSICRR